jgi:hypothetical protein
VTLATCADNLTRTKPSLHNETRAISNHASHTISIVRTVAQQQKATVGFHLD